MRTRHDLLTQSIHWGVALLVLAIYAIGLGREALPKGDFRTFLLGLHMSLGIGLMALLAVRIGWRFAAPTVAPVPMSDGMRFAARLGHGALYGLMIAAPVVGLLAAWMKGRVVGFFGMPIPSPFLVDTAAAKWLEEAHELTANSLVALAGLHAVAALIHHLVLKDGTLRRMLPGRSVAA